MLSKCRREGGLANVKLKTSLTLKTADVIYILQLGHDQSKPNDFFLHLRMDGHLETHVAISTGGTGEITLV
jgi:hypothetical protein